MDLVPTLVGADLDREAQVALYSTHGHGISRLPGERSAWSLVDGRMRILLDPPDDVRPEIAPTHLVLHGPTAGAERWIAAAPGAIVVATAPLLRDLGATRTIEVTDRTALELPSGRALAFVTSPFLPAEGSCATFDEASGYLFTGDVAGVVDRRLPLVADDWEAHWRAMRAFHIGHMPSSRALRGFLQKIAAFPVRALLPARGPIVPEHHVRAALDALAEIPCGLDLLYPPSHLEEALHGMVSRGRH